MKVISYSLRYQDESVALFIEEYSENDKKWSVDKAREYLKRNIDNFPEYCFVAVDDDQKYLGGIFCRLDPYYDGYLLLIDSLQIKKEARKQGIAKKLLETVLTVTKKNNIKGIHMLVDERTDFPKSWYQKMGFKKTGWVEYEKLDDKI